MRKRRWIDAGYLSAEISHLRVSVTVRERAGRKGDGRVISGVLTGGRVGVGDKCADHI